MAAEPSIYSIMELIGTIAFACSGAMVAMQRRLDLLGVVLLAFVTSFGGGVCRDILIQQTPPAFFMNPDQAYLVIWLSLTMFVIFKMQWNDYLHLRTKAYNDFMNILDAIGLGVFTVTGINKGLSAGFEEYIPFCAFLGVLTGVGGGILRDILSGQTPVVFRKNIYVSASIAGAVSYLYFLPVIGDRHSMILSSIIVFVIRMLASHYRWDLPKAYQNID